MKIEVQHLSKSYGNLKVISDFNIDLPSDKIHCIFGPSGCGKTTFINILTGLSDADEGGIQGIENKTFSYVFQEDRLLPWATVEENMLFVLKDRYHKKERNQLVDNYLSLVGLKEFRNHYPEELSGGMRQRVAIARALAYGGDILVMDEPFKGLHLELKKGLMDYIIDYRHEKNRFFFFITHDIDEALYIADIIHIFEGPPLTLKNSITIDIPACNRGQHKDEMKQYKEALLKEL